MGLQRLACLQANSCVGFRDDASGHKGIFIDTGVLKAAAVGAIASTLRSLGPRVLPWRELVRRVATLSGLGYQSTMQMQSHGNVWQLNSTNTQVS